MPGGQGDALDPHDLSFDKLRMSGTSLTFNGSFPPFVVSLSNHERLSVSTLPFGSAQDKLSAQGKRVDSSVRGEPVEPPPEGGGMYAPVFRRGFRTALTANHPA